MAYLSSSTWRLQLGPRVHRASDTKYVKANNILNTSRSSVPSALAHIGWASYLSEQPEIGLFRLDMTLAGLEARETGFQTGRDRNILPLVWDLQIRASTVLGVLKRL